MRFLFFLVFTYFLSVEANPNFYSPVTSDDISSRDISQSSREPRFNFYFGNGTAMVNTTTVAISTSFAVIVGLGLMSVFHQQTPIAREENVVNENYDYYADWAVAHGQTKHHYKRYKATLHF